MAPGGTNMRCMKWIAACLGILLAVVVPGAAQAENVIEQETIAATEGNEWLSNEFEAFLGGMAGIDLLVPYGGDGSNAVANCQILLAVNAIVLNIAAAEGLGLIQDEDTTTLDGLFPILRPIGANGLIGPGNHVVKTHNGTASCEQAIGPIKVIHAAAPGWGEAAPVASEAAAMADTLGAELEQVDGLGGDNAILQETIAAAGLSDVIHNEAHVAITDGEANAVSNCQILIGWNMLAVNAALARSSGEIRDGDTIDVNLTLGDGRDGGDAAKLASVTETYAPDIVGEGGTSSCKQTIESITLVVGKPDDIGRQS